MSKLGDLCRRCKCNVTVTVNDHRNSYETAEQYLDHALGEPEPHDIEPEIRREMIARDSVIQCQFYPRTPVGFYEVWHYDLDTCLDICLKIMDREQG